MVYEYMHTRLFFLGARFIFYAFINTMCHDYDVNYLIQWHIDNKKVCRLGWD